MGDVRFVVDITAGTAGAKGNFTAFVLGADTPALLRSGAPEALGGQLDSCRDTLALGFREVGIPLKVGDMGRYISSIADFDERRGNWDREPDFSASLAEWTCPRKRPNLSNSGIRLPFTGDGMCSFAPCRTFSACKAATFGPARDGAPSSPKRIIMKSHVNWGHASASHIKRVWVDAEGDKLHLLHCVDEVLGHCEVCRASDRAPHVPIAGASASSSLSEKLQGALPFLGDTVALRVVNV